MDPDTTLRYIAWALDDGDHSYALQATADLLSWLHNGGYEPVWSNHPRATAFYRAALRLSGADDLVRGSAAVLMHIDHVLN